jgi:predicted nucleic acid-binding protein
MKPRSESPPIVVSNAGPLIALAKINALNLLTGIYGHIYTVESVYHETVTEGLKLGAPNAPLIQQFYEQGILEIKPLEGQLPPLPSQPKKIHPAEHESIQLAFQLKAGLLLLDDWDARQVAEANFQALRAKTVIKGTLGLIVTACQEQIITPSQAIEFLEAIKLRRDIWISAKLCNQVIQALQGT